MRLVRPDEEDKSLAAMAVGRSGLTYGQVEKYAEALDQGSGKIGDGHLKEIGRKICADPDAQDTLYKC